MLIAVVCGAGASSTFVAQRLQRKALTLGYTWECIALSRAAVGAAAADMLLLGPHMHADAADVRSEFTGPVALLPDDIFTDRDGSRTFDIVVSTLAAEKGTP